MVTPAGTREWWRPAPGGLVVTAAGAPRQVVDERGGAAFAGLVAFTVIRWVYAALAVAVLCTPLLPAGYLDRITTITHIEGDRTGSAEARWQDNLAAVSWVVKHPIVGAGIGSNQLALNEERGGLWVAVHNVYLQHAVDLGLPGLALFLVVLGGCIRGLGAVQREARTRGDTEVWYLAEGTPVSLIAFAVGGEPVMEAAP